MALVKPIVFQVVGYQDSGKTTTMVEIVKLLSAEGYQIITIKHHGHGGKPDLAEGKDSERHVKAGALASIIQGEGRVLIQAEKQEWSLQEEIKLASAFTPDFILIEGYKHESFPKAVLLRDERDFHLLEDLNNIKIVFCRKPELLNELTGLDGYPMFAQTNLFYAWIVSYFKSVSMSMREKM